MICPSNPWLSYTIGYAVACILGNFVVGPAVKKLWSIAENDFAARNITLPPITIRPQATISLWHGITERAIYATSVILGKPEGIAVWLGFKAVVRWKVSEEADPRHVPGALIYLIGTALNVGFGIVGGFIALGRCSF